MRLDVANKFYFEFYAGEIVLGNNNKFIFPVVFFQLFMTCFVSYTLQFEIIKTTFY
jgi:hypothetical protein